MRTPAQIAASRANGAKSKGPITAQGKRNSSRNSTSHGLFADTIVLEEEKKEEFFIMLDELLDEHQPATPTEIMMVETIAAARWKQNRIWGMQKIAFDHDVSSSPDPSAIPPLRAILSLQSSPEKVRSHELLLRYDIAFDRQISRALLRLQQLQDRRAQRTARALEVADHPDQSSRPVPATQDTQPPEETVAPPTIPVKPVPQAIRSRPAVGSLRPAVGSLRPAVDSLRPAVDSLRKDVPAKRTQQINENNTAQITRTQELPKGLSSHSAKSLNRVTRLANPSKSRFTEPKNLGR